MNLPHVTFSQGGQVGLDSPVALGGDVRPCLVAQTPAEMRFRVKLPPRAVMTFAIGIKDLPLVGSPASGDQEQQRATSGKVRFRIRVGEGTPTTDVFRREIHPSRREQWLDQSVDLHRFSGREVWLSFETSTEVEGPLGLVGLFAEPTLHDRARYREARGVILISVDTLRRDHVSVYGYRRKTTPGLERLAAEAVVFDDAVSTSSWTLPAHASLLASLYPSFHGAVNLHKGLSSDVTRLPTLLTRQGFFTQGIVTHLYLSEQYGFGLGFDRHVVLPEARAQQVTDRAIGFLRARGDQDFFLFLHYYDPHWHYDPPAPYDRTFDPNYDGSTTGIWWDFKDETLDTINKRDLDHIVALYDGEILYTDHHLDRLFREMKELGIFGSSLVVVTSDHGEEFLDHGGWEHQKTLYEEQIRIPLLIKLPPGQGPLQRRDAQVSLLDVAPTILDVLGLQVPSSFQGRSLLLPGSADRRTTGADLVWSETEHTIDGSHKLALRRGVTGRKQIFSVRAERWEATLVEIYELGEDRHEQNDLGGSERAGAEPGLSRMRDFLADAAEWRRRLSPPSPVDLSPEQLDKLRVLGYVR